ncbi:MAG: response regulator transcription factor [candidate division KSB1 bacterium]|nr:response regulator transcription factor [candidate division KSB1 bacterium]MDZ7302357.1 response regulator transcription factor [candidate division KSB1 bacterium]MDZ7311209.1 response regulator transcription factor [candidate division KSB1 bacterium]
MKDISVVVIEDNEKFRNGLAQLIEGTPGYRCVGTFSDCEKALPEICNLLPDVILMDIGLPGMSGIEGVKAIKACLPEIEILMLTIYEDDAKVFDSLYAGASGYLLKKTAPAKILEAITEIHDGGSPMSPKIARKVLDLFHKTAPAEETEQLSSREKEILQLLVEGLSYKAIGKRLFISPHTVRAHLKNIYEKLHVHSKSEAAVKAVKQRLFP